MDLARPIRLDRLSGPFISHLTARDAAIWVLKPFVAEAGSLAVANLLRLPWRFALSESADPELLREFDRAEDAADALVRRRGFIQIVDTNPADIPLPPRCLPIYLLNGRDTAARGGGIVAMTRRLTMLDVLRRVQIKELLILAGRQSSLPTELSELWQDGLRTTISLVSDDPQAEALLETWRKTQPLATSTAYFPITASTFCEDLFARFLEQESLDRVTLRIRDVHGELQTLDITGLDDPEHPLLSNYELLQEKSLQHVQHDDLTSDEIQDFFRDPATSWRPYAAGMPWQRDDKAWQGLRGILRHLDREGVDESRITYISSEYGAGGTTLLRSLAWSTAAAGYPTLVAGNAPFTPKGLEIATFISRVLEKRRTGEEVADKDRRYETPWVIAYDRQHWQGRTDELRALLRELVRSGRPICIIVVSGPYTAEFLDNRVFVPLANLSHQVSLQDTMDLGRHLNRYLAAFGSTRADYEWQSFYEASAVNAERGIAAFWIALSFWVQRQFDMNETIQSWIFRQYKDASLSADVRRAIIDIAALSTERHPLPETMLPPTVDWPVAQKLEDVRREIGALALTRIAREGDRFWALAHNVIGRFLLTALFYDQSGRENADFPGAQNPEHLRFLALRRICKNPALGYVENHEIAEEFAVSIFKIDPDHGHGSFIAYWRDALEALDEMPKAFRTTNRTFLHHTAISRRRISSQTDYFQINIEERIALLERAVRDIRYAIENIPVTPDSESDLSLYNSLALAYHDLADEEVERGADRERVLALQASAHDATQRAYRLNPDNSFVIETYARSLLSDARQFPDKAIENAVEALNIVYAAMARDKAGQRGFSLSRLADSALALMLKLASQADATREPTTESEALLRSIRALTEGVNRFEGMEIKDFPAANRRQTAETLAIPLLRGNPQAVRLLYTLRCIDEPGDFRGQLELLQSLQDGGTVFTPQMRLELALLLQQCDRHHEAQRLFRELRRLWKEGDYYVEVPERLRWLLTSDGKSERQVSAKVFGDIQYRSIAKVRELQDTEVLFRPQEFGQKDLRPGTVIRGYISFGHNGPFLRPTTAIQN